MELEFSADLNKQQIFSVVRSFLEGNGFRITTYDETRPWGGFFVLDESQSDKFIEYFFKDIPASKTHSTSTKLSPKILLVEKGKRLSWQYHHRRAEIWKVIGGTVEVVTSETDQEVNRQTKKKEEIIILKQGERHRLIGTNDWGVIAEIWQHTDPNYPSNEDDIIRIQDDFGR
jgi:mannose-6-phosphate isomerase-like protein (cupin superfamily)